MRAARLLAQQLRIEHAGARVDALIHQPAHLHLAEPMRQGELGDEPHVLRRLQASRKAPLQPLQEHIEAKGQLLIRRLRAHLHECLLLRARKRLSGIHHGTDLHQLFRIARILRKAQTGCLISLCPQLIQIQPAQHLMAQKRIAFHRRAELIDIRLILWIHVRAQQQEALEDLTLLMHPIDAEAQQDEGRMIMGKMLVCAQRQHRLIKRERLMAHQRPIQQAEHLMILLAKRPAGDDRASFLSVHRLTYAFPDRTAPVVSMILCQHYCITRHHIKQFFLPGSSARPAGVWLPAH